MEAKNNTFNPSEEQIKAAFAAAKTEESKNILCALFGNPKEEQDNRPVTERVKTLIDAINTLGEEYPYCKALEAYNEQINGTLENLEDVGAHLKLRIITAALNEEWTPNWVDTNECKYYPWFTIYTKEEIDETDEEERSRVGGRASDGAFACGGLVYSYASNVSTHSYTSFGSRLAFKSRELAEYAGKQFGEIYADFLI